jgi:hypothetical protein
LATFAELAQHLKARSFKSQHQQKQLIKLISSCDSRKEVAVCPGLHYSIKKWKGMKLQQRGFFLTGEVNLNIGNERQVRHLVV